MAMLFQVLEQPSWYSLVVRRWLEELLIKEKMLEQ